MSTAKQELMNLLATMPDDCSLEDILYKLYVIAEIKRSDDHVDAHGTISHTEAERRLNKWLNP
jgi:hypothetical protein